MLRKNGFTLIELLIVVAIIAILALIAVPNFLEAQTRSKVAQVKANMRTVATGLEAYCVDNKHYPPAAAHGSWLRPEKRLACLTTPVAYLTTFPKDIFEKYPSWCYWYGMYWYEDRESCLTYWQAHPGTQPLVKHTEVAWLMKSKGPDCNDDYWGYPWGGPEGIKEYDPTNGTISRGDIHRFGPGNIETITLLRE
ncbi:prepilin-type N-terminal cleavage/methylation domain-containing protein [Candidatus Sumerlaeota bacterium]|nr:prepilin-type N-terminal cleavage/methylation domain-containing protein [Candidatus Sumerlaeota bacterium]